MFPNIFEIKTKHNPNSSIFLILKYKIQRKRVYDLKLVYFDIYIVSFSTIKLYNKVTLIYEQNERLLWKQKQKLKGVKSVIIKRERAIITLQLSRK